MTREELIKQCRYYKGEEDCPFDGKDQNKAMFWSYEEKWVQYTLSDKNYLNRCLDEYKRNGLMSFKSDDGVPATLKAILFNRYSYWYEGDSIGFKNFYTKYYM